MTEMTKDQLDSVLGSWQTINKALSTMSETDCKNALNRELVGNRRKDVATRIHQRYTVLRSQRERTELLAALDDQPVFLKPLFSL